MNTTHSNLNDYYTLKICINHINPEIRKYKNNILKFVKSMNKSEFFKNSNFTNNIRTLKIIIDSSIKEEGNYNIRTNTITLKEKNNHVLNHELIHMSTSKNINNTLFCGFNIITNDIDFGIGLMEGYTEYTRLKYFKKVSSSYKIPLILSKYFELVLGSEFEKDFFNFDLLSVIEKLNNYSNLDEILCIINKIDLLLSNSDINNKNIILLEVIDFLEKIYNSRVVNNSKDFKSIITKELSIA